MEIILNIMKQQAIAFANHTSGLKNSKEKFLINYERKTGFLGFIIPLKNNFEINFFKKKKLGLKYLLSYKLLQDHIVTIFSALRSCGGLNNNRNIKQFE